MAWLLLLLWIPAFASELPPVSHFATLPNIRSITLSPDGETMLVLRAMGETYQAVAVNLTTGKSNMVMASDPEQFLFNWCRYANNTRVVCSIRRYGTLVAAQYGAAIARRYLDGRTTFTRLVAADINGSNSMQLIPEPVNRTGRDLLWNATDQDNVISWLPDDPEHILIQLNRDDRLRPSVYRLNVYTNKLDRQRKFHDSVYSWYADRDGELRFAGGYRKSRPVAFSVSNNRALQVNLDHLGGVSVPVPVGMNADGSRVFVLSYLNGPRRQLVAVDGNTGELAEVLLADDTYDVFGSLVLHPKTREPLRMQYRRERVTQHWFDADLQRSFLGIEAALEGTHSSIQLQSASDDLNRIVLMGEGNGTTPTFYLFDREKKELKVIGRNFSDLDQVVDLVPVRYPARDGTELPAYLARPQGPGPFPTIVFPHGGPNTRDDAGFDYWVQFFVSRGYAVLKPNFRGSTGYGSEHLQAGFEQWGLRMQDDVMDGLDWLIKEKIADPGRVCVVGGSYGGYVALVAAFKTPERLRCAVSFAGVSDLYDLKAHVSLFDLGELSLARIQTGAAVTANSPFHRVKDIDVPLLIVHGDVDRSVMIDQSRELVAALDKAGKQYTYIEQTNGDHFLSIQSHRLEFFEAMDEFLQTHLAAPTAASASQSTAPPTESATRNPPGP